MALLEVCVESISSALTAQEFGARRVEFCDNIAEGGTTPSAGNIHMARELLNIELFPIIRPRGGGFVYSNAEFLAMERDVRVCGEAGCDGIVTGVLRPDGRIDTDRCRRLVEIAAEYGMQSSFHRAFDMSGDLPEALEDIIAAGFIRVLTSGGAATAGQGVETIKRLNDLSAGRIAVMPGSGVTPQNAADILSATGCREIHGTFRSFYPGPDGEPEWAYTGRWGTDPEKLKEVVKTIKNI